MTLKGQGHDPNTLRVQYLENSWRCYLATIAISAVRYGGYPSDRAWLLVCMLQYSYNLTQKRIVRLPRNNRGVLSVGVLPLWQKVNFITCRSLLLARYVPNVAKRSIWDQCKYVYIDDRPTSDRRPTTDLSFRKFQMAISPQPIVRSTPCLVLGWGFRGRRI